jgi:hypothetical protein
MVHPNSHTRLFLMHALRKMRCPTWHLLAAICMFTFPVVTIGGLLLAN